MIINCRKISNESRMIIAHLKNLRSPKLYKENNFWMRYSVKSATHVKHEMAEE